MCPPSPPALSEGLGQRGERGVREAPTPAVAGSTPHPISPSAWTFLSRRPPFLYINNSVCHVPSSRKPVLITGKRWGFSAAHRSTSPLPEAQAWASAALP